MTTRFDYIAYDELSRTLQQQYKYVFSEIADSLEVYGMDSEAKRNALQRLEESYMWVGKLIRDTQIHRNRGAILEEERSNS